MKSLSFGNYPLKHTKGNRILLINENKEISLGNIFDKGKDNISKEKRKIK